MSKCYQCFRPKKSCYCDSIQRFDPGVKFVFLMHPKEAYKQKTGTGRLACLSLVDAEIVIDTTFDENKRVQALLADDSYSPFILYPGEDASFASSPGVAEKASQKKLLVFLVDATWIQARKMMYRSPELRKLPKLSFQREYRSTWLIKTQPEDYCLSTIESTFCLIEELKEEGIVNQDVDASGLLSIFKQMNEYQETCRKEENGTSFRIKRPSRELL